MYSPQNQNTCSHFLCSPVIGGTFAEPATELPDWFNYPFFKAYPYVLPCIISATLAFIAALVSLTYLREVRGCSLALQHMLTRRS